MGQKLELIWLGKDNPISPEPRILIEDSERSYKKEIEMSLLDEAQPTFDNLLIHGDNLLALKALEADFTGKVDCVYIDPPYNANTSNEHYDDQVEHSEWLRRMKPRMEILRNLLKKEGMFFCQIDDDEGAYLTVLLDEVFGRDNHINTICVNMSNMSGPKVNNAINGKRFPKIKEYILVYSKNHNFYKLRIPKQNKEKWDSEYNLIIPELTEESSFKLQQGQMTDDELDHLTLQSLNQFLSSHSISQDDDKWKFDNAYRIVASKPNTALLRAAREMEFNSDIAYITSSRGLKKIIKTDFNRETPTARIELTLASEHLSVYFGDHWDDIVTTGGVAQEGGVVYKASKKPEKLIERIIECCTKEGDLVLDSFLGSGTTAAVAHKMKRRWIGIEMMDNVAYNLSKSRLDKVIDGDDKTGISAKRGWAGGGGYKFYELAPTLVQTDPFGIPVINKEYNQNMLAAAVAKHEGFVFNPNQDVFWKQSSNGEKTYLYVTTTHVSNQIVETIHQSMEEGEYLIVACKSFDSAVKNLFKNIMIKKIPQSLLKNCEFGVENYSLNIVNPPEYEDLEGYDDEQY